jgi:hypothetical protein
MNKATRKIQGEGERWRLQTIQNIRENPERERLHQELILKRAFLLLKEAIILLVANEKERSLINEGIKRRGSNKPNPRRIIPMHMNTNERARIFATTLKSIHDALRKESHVSM